MTSFTVVHAERLENLPAKGERPELQIQRLELQGVSGSVERVVRLDKPLPVAGELLEGTIEDGQYGKKLKAPPRQGGGFGGRQEDPARQAMIVHQHSQSAAIAIFSEARERNIEPNELAAKVEAMAQVLTDKVIERGKQA